MAEREKVIRALENCTDEIKCRDCPWETCETFCLSVKVPLDLAKAALSLLKAQEPGWISVKDRLPDEEGTYLVFREEPYGMITIAWYLGHENGWLALDGGFYADEVLTHYMPLPDPPKGEG